MKEVKVLSTKNQLEEFKESLIWKDICSELENWNEGFFMEQDSIVDDAAANNPSTASVLLHMGDINGRKKAVAYMTGIIDMFINILEADNVRRDQTDRSGNDSPDSDLDQGD